MLMELKNNTVFYNLTKFVFEPIQVQLFGKWIDSTYESCGFEKVIQINVRFIRLYIKLIQINSRFMRKHMILESIHDSLRVVYKSVAVLYRWCAQWRRKRGCRGAKCTPIETHGGANISFCTPEICRCQVPFLYVCQAAHAQQPTVNGQPTVSRYKRPFQYRQTICIPVRRRNRRWTSESEIWSVCHVLWPLTICQFLI